MSIFICRSSLLSCIRTLGLGGEFLTRSIVAIILCNRCIKSRSSPVSCARTWGWAGSSWPRSPTLSAVSWPGTPRTTSSQRTRCPPSRLLSGTVSGSIMYVVFFLAVLLIRFILIRIRFVNIWSGFQFFVTYILFLIFLFHFFLGIPKTKFFEKAKFPPLNKSMHFLFTGLNKCNLKIWRKKPDLKKGCRLQISFFEIKNTFHCYV